MLSNCVSGVRKYHITLVITPLESVATRFTHGNFRGSLVSARCDKSVECGDRTIGNLFVLHSPFVGILTYDVHSLPVPLTVICLHSTQTFCSECHCVAYPMDLQFGSLAHMVLHCSREVSRLRILYLKSVDLAQQYEDGCLVQPNFKCIHARNVL